MQTFLPLSDYKFSAKVLDYRRLGKQRVECLQLLNVNLPIRYPDLFPEYKSRGWINHPAGKMWRGYESQLILYAMTVCEEWIARGYKDSILPKLQEMYSKIPEFDVTPVWLGDKNLHASHRSNLLRKDSVYYGKFGWNEPDSLPYIWPV